MLSQFVLYNVCERNDKFVDSAPTFCINLTITALKTYVKLIYTLHACTSKFMLNCSLYVVVLFLFSITLNKKAGCFHVPVASAFLVVPRGADSWFAETLTCSRVKYSDCKVKPREGEFFVSRILKMEPEGVVFDKPVTVLLSHSLYEDQDFLDFYELVIENVGPAGLQDLKTERISFIEGMDSKLIIIVLNKAY